MKQNALPRIAALFVAAVSVLAAATFFFSTCASFDEVCYIDPGVNLAMGRGFISAVWSPQNPYSVWGSSTPGMPILYATWFSAFGFGWLQSKILSALIYFGGIFSLVRWTRARYQLSADATAIVLFCLVAAPTMTIQVAAKCRLELFAPILFFWLLTIFVPADRADKLKVFSATAFGLLTVLLGLHFAGYFAIATATLFIFTPSKARLINALLVAIGMLLGSAILFASYRHIGAWDAFVASRMWHYDPKNIPLMVWVPRGWHMYTVGQDLFMAAIAMAAAAIFIRLKNANISPEIERAAWLGLAVFICVPPLMNTVGIYYVDYAWMVAIPIALLFAPFASTLFVRRSIFPVVVMLTLAVLAQLGSIVRLIHRNIRDRADMQPGVVYLQRDVPPGQAIQCSYLAYYDLKETHPDFYMGKSSSYWTPGSHSDVKWILERRAHARQHAERLGGEWSEVPVFRQDSEWTLLRRAVPLR